MTYDAHVFFATDEATRRGADILKSCRIEGKPLFLVEPDDKNPCKLFYRVAMTDPVSEGATFTFQNHAASFAEHFTAIVQRTGKHNQTGDLYCNFELGRSELKNHEVLEWLDKAVAPVAA